MTKFFTQTSGGVTTIDYDRIERERENGMSYCCRRESEPAEQSWIDLKLQEERQRVSS